MTLPGLTDPVWQDLITGKKTCEFEFLAARMLLGRAKHALFLNPSIQKRAELVGELRAIFEKNPNHPAVCRDIEKILKVV